MAGRQRYLDLPALSRFGYDPAWFQDSYREWVAKFAQPLAPDATLQQALVWCSMACGVRWQDVRAGARGGPFTDAKRMLVEQARLQGYTLADVASFLDCTPGALSQLFER